MTLPTLAQLEAVADRQTVLRIFPSASIGNVVLAVFRSPEPFDPTIVSTAIHASIEDATSLFMLGLAEIG